MAKKSFKDLFYVGSHGTNILFQNFSYVLFVVLLAIIYIANSHYALRKVRQIHVTQQEVRDLKRAYNTKMSSLMYNTKFSEIEADVAQSGLRPSGRHPRRLVVDK